MGETGEARAARDRREARFERLYEDHRRRVRAYALRRAEPEAAGDAVAETFLVAWRRLDDVPEDALPWLFGVARRVLANQRRSADRRAALVDRLGGVVEPAPTDPREAVGEALALRAALRRLSDRDRETLMLVAWEGLEPARAAAAAECSRAGFAVRLHRARRRLETELEREEHPTAAARAAGNPSTAAARAAAEPSAGATGIAADASIEAARPAADPSTSAAARPPDQTLEAR